MDKESFRTIVEETVREIYPGGRHLRIRRELTAQRMEALMNEFGACRRRVEQMNPGAAPMEIEEAAMESWLPVLQGKIKAMS
jgi:hypothetical protein